MSTDTARSLDVAPISEAACGLQAPGSGRRLGLKMSASDLKTERASTEFEKTPAGCCPKPKAQSHFLEAFREER